MEQHLSKNPRHYPTPPARLSPPIYSAPVPEPPIITRYTYSHAFTEQEVLLRKIVGQIISKK
jgi:hypothetical protein